MRGLEAFFVAIFALTAVDALTSSSASHSCALGPGYWCSNDTAARSCGATEFCRQLWARTTKRRVVRTDDAAVLKPSSAVSVPVADTAAAAACSVCQASLIDAKVALQQQPTDDAIAKLLKQRLPRDQLRLETIEALEALVDIYLAEIIRALRVGAEPKQVCAMLALCDNTKVTPAVRPKYARYPVLLLMQLQGQLNAPVKPQKPLSAIVSCRSCQTLVMTARHLVRDGQSEAEVGHLLKSTACRLPPKESERLQCTNAVDHYLPLLFELLSTELDPNLICQVLGACQQLQGQLPTQPKQLSSQPPTALAARTGPQCLLCEFVIRELERQIGANRSAAAIEAALDRVCSLLPQSARTDCDSLVRQLGPVIVRLLVNGLSPRLACSALGLCTAAHRTLPPAKWMLAYQRAAQSSHQDRRLIYGGADIL